MTISRDFTVNGVPFTTWFNTSFLPTQAGKIDSVLRKPLFPYKIKEDNVKKNFLDILPKLTGQASLPLMQFVALFLFIYNETGGEFRSMPEIGGSAWYAAHGYNDKSKGRGLIQLTSADNYRAVLSQLGYNYDSLTAQELNTLFEKPEIYIPATKIYLTSPTLAGNAWKGTAQGNYKAFGRAISGADWYGTLLDERAQPLLTALQKAKISQPMSQTTIAGLGVGFFLLLALAYYFRKEIKSFYKSYLPI